jgi:L-alanine-DL-glutamate epimerase-like enolase superfamily enzyme
MKIAQFQSVVVRLPADEPLANGPARPGVTRDFVILRLLTDDGLEGIGLTTAFTAPLIGTLKSAVDTLATLAIGEDPLRIEAITGKLRKAADSCGPGGITTLAISAIDIALWDIKAKFSEMPLATLLGGHRERVPTYASGALAREFALDDVVYAAGRLAERGFRQMKMQLGLPGKPSAAREVERARLVREAIGDDIDLMCDINQIWNVNEAITIGRALEDVRFTWLEDIVAHDDPVGMARVAAALDTPLAAGEYVYGSVPFRQLLEARAVDIVMIDVLRAGGITQWMKIAGMAQAFNLPVVSHLIPELHVHLIAAIPNGMTVEYMPWSVSLFEEVPVPVDGELIVPSRPGLGLTLNQEVVERFAV